MKLTNAFFVAACAAALLLQTHRVALAENSALPRQADNTEEKPGPITAEDQEVIEHMEMLKNLKLYKTEDIEMLLTLDVLTANE